MLDSKKIIGAITKARMDYKNNKLPHDLLNSTEKKFWKSQNQSEDKKNKLIALAKKNAKRPVKRTDSLGNALCNYTSHDKTTYDAVFTKNIKKIAPHWFKKSSDHAKDQFVKMAKQKSAKPKSSSLLYKKLIEYTNKTRSSYDAQFDSTIRNLAPHWFVKTSKVNKEKLLLLAEKGAARPKVKMHKLGYALVSYCNPSSNVYDPKFIAKLKKLAPKWFRSV